jgi:hypothetical protein
MAGDMIMLTTTIRHGDLVIDVEPERAIRITRQSTAQAVEVSPTEWRYILRVAELHDFPMAPPHSMAIDGV